MIFPFIFPAKRLLCFNVRLILTRWLFAIVLREMRFFSGTGHSGVFTTKKPENLTPAFELVSAAVLCSVSAQ